MQSRIPARTSFQDLLAAEFERDPAAREEWERTALGREVAIELIRYRAENDLSQRALAAQLGVSQPRVAKLEIGEHNPDVDTLVKISRATGLEFVIDIVPADRIPKLVSKQVRESRERHVRAGVAVIAAASSG